MRLKSPTCAHFCGLVVRLKRIAFVEIDERKSCVWWLDTVRTGQAMRPRFINNLLKHIFGDSKTFLYSFSVHIEILCIAVCFVAAATTTAWHPFHEFILDINARFISSCTLNSYLIIKINNDNNHNLNEFKENGFFLNIFIIMGIKFTRWLRLSVFYSYFLCYFSIRGF